MTTITFEWNNDQGCFENEYSVLLRDKLTQEEFNSSMSEINNATRTPSKNKVWLAVLFFVPLPCFIFAVLSIVMWHIPILLVFLAIATVVSLVALFLYIQALSQQKNIAIEKAVVSQNRKFAGREVTWHYVPSSGTTQNKASYIHSAVQIIIGTIELDTTDNAKPAGPNEQQHAIVISEVHPLLNPPNSF